MRFSTVLMATAVLATGVLYGWSNREVRQQEKIHVAAIAYRGQESKSLGHRIKEDTRDSTDALGITPRVKKAIIEDRQLNNERNHINVDTKDYIVHLKGHVYSKAIKQRAGSVAAAKLAKMHKNYKVSNELTIGG